jgi:hypothetical protein
MNLTSTFLSPYGVEGDKTVAFELLEQLDRAPDWIVIPVSVGPLLVGIYKGFLIKSADWLRLCQEWSRPGSQVRPDRQSLPGRG